MWYAVELKNGLRQSDGVRDMGSKMAMEDFAAKNRKESNDRWSELGIPDHGWTTVVVDEKGLAKLPMKEV